MRGRFLLVVLAALVAAAPAYAGSRTCPGPGCMPVGSFTVATPASGKVTFYVVTFKGTATKPPVISLALTGPPPTGHVAIAAAEGKAKLAGGTATVTILLGVSNVKRAVAAARGSTGFEGFAPSGTFTPAGNPTVTPTPCHYAEGDYHALSQLGESWYQFWLKNSPLHPTGNTANFILENQFKASCGK